MHRDVGRSGLPPLGLTLVCAVLLAGCQQAPLQEGGTLQSYEGLTRDDGIATKAGIRLDAVALRSARTVRLAPTSLGREASNAPLSDEQRRLVANALDRALCTSLGERYRVVPRGQPADLAVRATVTHLVATDEVAAGVSKAVMIVPSLVGAPLPAPRVPYGLGSLSVEGEAVDAQGRQVAAMVWSRGAGVLATSATVSTVGDAYDLAGDFGSDFGQMLATGRSPFGHLAALPSMDQVGTAFGGAPKQPACEAYGRAPALGGMVGSTIGLPPEWTDDGRPAAAKP